MLKIAGNRVLESDMFDKMIMINLAICLSLENENISFYRAIYDPISKKSVKSVFVCCQKNFQLTNKNPRLSTVSPGLQEKESLTYNFAGK